MGCRLWIGVWRPSVECMEGNHQMTTQISLLKAAGLKFKNRQHRIVLLGGTHACSFALFLYLAIKSVLTCSWSWSKVVPGSGRKSCDVDVFGCFRSVDSQCVCVCVFVFGNGSLLWILFCLLFVNCNMHPWHCMAHLSAILLKVRSQNIIY